MMCCNFLCKIYNSSVINQIYLTQHLVLSPTIKPKLQEYYFNKNFNFAILDTTDRRSKSPEKSSLKPLTPSLFAKSTLNGSSSQIISSQSQTTMSSSSTSQLATGSREYRSGSPATKPKPTAPARKGSGASSLLQQQQQQQLQQQQKSLIPTKKSSGVNDINNQASFHFHCVDILLLTSPILIKKTKHVQ